MNEKWKVKVYESPGGDEPVEVFLNTLDEKARLKVSRTFELLYHSSMSLQLKI